MTANAQTPTGGWSDEAQVGWYLERIGKLEARRAGEHMLVEVLTAASAPVSTRVLDLGCGDGRLTALMLASCPTIQAAVAVDRSEPMMAHARERFAGEPRVEVRRFDMGDAMTELGTFDVIVSGFAIHHLSHDRKRELFGEISAQLAPGGVFANLEVVASASPARHAEFLAAIGRTADDPEDRLAPVHEQLGWMRDAGMVEVDCLWRWRGFALLVGMGR